MKTICLGIGNSNSVETNEMEVLINFYQNLNGINFKSRI